MAGKLVVTVWRGLGGGVVGMGWSFQVGRVFGIPIRVHATFLLLLLLVFIWPMQGIGETRLSAVLFILALFACVVVHELSHSLVARRFGIAVRQIILLPIGGVAMMERMPEDPRQELQVALAGPLTSLVVAAVLAAVVVIAAGPASLLGAPAGGLVHFLARLAALNVILAAFNLLPMFPADGGRVLRALLALRMDYQRATHAAAVTGQFMAVGLGILGLFTGDWWLLIIAVFLYMGAAAEDSQVRLRGALARVPARAAMVSEYRALDKDDSLADAFAHAGASYQHDFPVTDEGRLVGLVTRQALITGMHERGGQGQVQDVMIGGPCEVHPEDSLATLYERIAAGSCPIAAVTDGEHLLGLVTPESISQYLMASSMQRRPPA